MSVVLNLWVSLALVALKVRLPKAQIMVANSCTDLDDGEHWLKFADDDSNPLVRVECSNGYAIVDIGKDADWVQYLSSHRKIHTHAMGPTKNDHGNWETWFLPDSDQFLVSPSCDICDASDSLQVHGTNTAYYSTSHFSGCSQNMLAHAACDIRYDDYVCQFCEEEETEGRYSSRDIYNGLNDLDDTIHPSLFVNGFGNNVGSCPFMLEKSNSTFITAQEFESCNDKRRYIAAMKPSLGMNSQFCVCVSSGTATEYYDISLSSIEDKLKESDGDADSVAEDALSHSTDDKYYLYSSDFEDGTYRITEPGTYYVMEDITFDFKGLSLDSFEEPISQSWNGVEGAWWPTMSEDNDIYPGAGQLYGPFWMGFFAGITIESNDVILDLNRHSLKMSTAFYYQQGFFANIALMSQSFLPSQGFGNFGTEPVFAENVIVRNGELGLTSHWGIQGLKNKNVIIEDLKIYDFKTHGIGMSGFDGLTIRNVDIGPNMFVDKLRPFYSQMRHFINIWQHMIADVVTHDACVNLVNRESCVTLQDLYDEAIISMDMAFEYAVFDRDWDALFESGELDDSETLEALWTKNRDALISEKGHPETSGVFGLFLNYPAANNRFWYTSNDNIQSTDLNLDNVYIHDMKHSSIENIGLKISGDVNGGILNPYGALVTAEFVFGNTVRLDDIYDSFTTIASDSADADEIADAVSFMDSLQYVGNTLLDIHIVTYEMIRAYGASWNYISGSDSHHFELVNFALKEPLHQSRITTSLTFENCCSQDSMGHPGKGVIGVRIVGVDGITINGLTIRNLQSYTPLGSVLCDGSNGITDQLPYLDGFTMNRAVGMDLTYATASSMDNIQIDNIGSMTGPAFGMSVWFSSDSVLNSLGTDISISHHYAGIRVNAGVLDYSSGANRAPEACALRIYDSDGVRIMNDNDTDTYPNSQMWSFESINGEYGCGGTIDTYSSVGDVTLSSLQPSSYRSGGAYIGGVLLIIFVIIGIYTCVNNGKNGASVDELQRLLPDNKHSSLYV